MFLLVFVLTFFISHNDGNKIHYGVNDNNYNSRYVASIFIISDFKVDDTFSLLYL